MEYNGKNASLCEAGRSFLKLDNIHEFAHTDIHTWLIHGCCSEFSDSILTTTLRGQKNEKTKKVKRRGTDGISVRPSRSDLYDGFYRLSYDPEPDLKF